jgi:hypothetical protein
VIGVAARLRLCEAGPQAHEAAAAMLERVSEPCPSDSESFLNPAKEIALQLAGTLPAILGSTPLAGVAAYRFACQLNENAKYPGIHGVLPEAKHNQVVAFDGPFAPGREPHPPGPAGGPGSGGAGAGVALRLVMLVDAPEHPQVTKRREVSAELARERRIGVTELAVGAEHPPERLAGLIQLIGYSTVYLGIALGLDPSPISAIGCAQGQDRVAGPRREAGISGESESTWAVTAALLANVGIAATKLAAFLITGSASMLAETLHSLADTCNEALLLVGQRRASRRRVRGARGRHVPGGLFDAHHGGQVRQRARQAGLARFHPPGQGPRASRGVARGHRGHRRLVFALAGVSLAVITGNGAWDGAGSIAIGVLLCLVAVVLAAEMKSLLIGESASA